MILVKLNKFNPVLDLEHISTTFRLYRDPDLQVLVDEQKESKSKDLYFYPMTLPKGAVFYLKYIRHFNDPEASIESEVIEVYDNGEEFSEMLLKDDVIVDQPTVNFDMDTLLSKDKLIINCSKFRSNFGTHEYTNWIIVDSTNKVLFSSLRDKVNKETITIENTYDFTNKNLLKVIVSHGTLANIESEPCIFEIRTGFYNFEILTNLKLVPAYRDLEVKFKHIDTTKPLGIYKIELRDTKDNSVWYTINDVRDNLSVVFPWYLFRDNSDINMVIEASDLLGGFYTITKKITVQKYQTDFIRNPEKKYRKILSKAIRSTTKLANHMSISPLNEKLIGIPNSSTLKLDCYDFDYVERKFINTNKSADGITLLNKNIEGIFIDVFNNDYLLIDSYSSSGKPTFSIYKHILQSNSYTLVKTLTRENETKCLGYTNAILQISYKEFLYIPVGSEYFYVYDFLSNSITKKGKIPLNDDDKDYNFIRLTKNRVLVMGGKDYSTTIYDYTKDVFTEGVYIRPQSFIDNKNLNVTLDNGDSLIFKTKEDNLLDPSLLYYELGKSKLDLLKSRFNHKFPKTSIRLNNGDLLLGLYDEETGGIRPDRPDIGDNGIIIPDLPGITGPIDPTWNILIVENGEDKLVNDLYQYDLVHIRGTGRLTWVTPKNVTEFDSGCYIATRSRSMRLSEFNARKYEQLHILDGVEFKLIDDNDASVDPDIPTTDPSHPDYVAPDDTTNPTNSIFYIFK